MLFSVLGFDIHLQYRIKYTIIEALGMTKLIDDCCWKLCAFNFLKLSIVGVHIIAKNICLWPIVRDPIYRTSVNRKTIDEVFRYMHHVLSQLLDNGSGLQSVNWSTVSSSCSLFLTTTFFPKAFWIFLNVQRLKWTTVHRFIEGPFFMSVVFECMFYGLLTFKFF